MILHMDVYTNLAAAFALLEQDDPTLAITVFEASLSDRLGHASGCIFQVGFDGFCNGKKRTGASRSTARAKALQEARRLLAVGDQKKAQSQLASACGSTPALIEGCVNACRRLGVPVVCHPEENDAGFGYNYQQGRTVAAAMRDADAFANGILFVVSKSSRHSAWIENFDLRDLTLPIGASWKKVADGQPGWRVLET
jgi:hypothetical protein